MFEYHYYIFLSLFIKFTCKPKRRLHVGEGVGVHDIHFGFKFYKFKLLGKLIV